MDIAIMDVHSTQSRSLRQALLAFKQIVGDHWVLTGDEDRNAYGDPYADNLESRPVAIVAPSSVSEIQIILKVANRYRVALWPISRGKNLGYGGSAPRSRETVVLDLGRLNRIIDVNERFGYCVVEPGVGFFELHAYLRKHNIPLWLSVPGNSWGSVLGNALEHGIGPFPYGDHAAQLCGMEVVLPEGDIVRTGMGAMTGNKCQYLFKHSFGPSWDQMFTQSNLGIVTQAGLWLMPAPEATYSLSLSLPNEDDLAWAVDVLHNLRMRGVLQSTLSLVNPIRIAAGSTQRSAWYSGPGALPRETINKIIEQYKCGQWNISIHLYGNADINTINARIAKDEFAKHTKSTFHESQWHQGEDASRSGSGAPTTAQLALANWNGGRGGHVDFSPVLPPSGADALKQYKLTRKTFESYGFDYSGGFTLGNRHLYHISMILYDRDNPAMTRSAHDLFRVLVAHAARDGFGEYRAHVQFMDEIALSFDFNGHSLLRLNQRIKDALDPNGILAPGKQGIWPRRLRRGVKS